MINWQNLPSTSTPLNATNLNNTNGEIDKRYNLDLGQILTSGTDLNTLTTIGAYYSNSVTITNSLVNCPITDAGFKLIVEYTTATNRIVQTIKVNNVNTSATYVRTYTGSWGEWNIILTGNYSTNERRVGIWIDSKPLYRKTIKSTNFSTSYSLGITNVENIISIKGMVHRKDYDNLYSPIPSRLADTGYLIDYRLVERTSSNVTVNINWGSSYTADKINDIVFIIEYTKTTD